MTVISSVYKDDDVKCHTSRADPPGERPGSFRSVVQSHVSQHTVLSVLFLLWHPLSVRLLSPPSPFSRRCRLFPLKEKLKKKKLSVCMLRHLVVIANRRITIYLYLYRAHKNKNKQKKNHKNLS